MVLKVDASGSFWKVAAGLLIVAVLAGCSTMPQSSMQEPVAKQAHPSPSIIKAVPVLPPAGSGRGGYYLDDGPGDQIPEGLHAIADAEPKIDPYSRAANRPYTVFGQTYTPITDNRPYKKRGYGSWYGKKFHGKKTSSGELYDMYKMTAAHPTLPIPCYARVTNLNNGNQVIVRVNDRGPFRSSRIIDLSYTAALKLGYLGKGSGMLEVEHLLPDEIERLAQNRRTGAPGEGGQPGIVASNAESRVNEEKGQQSRDLLDELISTSKDKAAPDPGTPASIDGYYLQLGSYRKAESAQSMQAKYALKWADRLPAIEVVNKGEHYRLYSGPFATRERALDAAQKFQDDGGARPLIVQGLPVR
jgi:rare lipoprotein A